MADEYKAVLNDACESGIACLSGNVREAFELELLRQLAASSSGGIGGGVFAGDYGAGQPTFTPTTNAAIAFDTSNGTQWNWYSGVWN